MKTPIPGLALFALLAGCAGTTSNAPSLMPRAIESRSAAEPVREVQPVAADPALDALIVERVAAIDAAGKAFAAAATATEARVKRAAKAAEGSEAWLDAQAALGELGQARSSADTALAALEELAIMRAGDGVQAYPALDTAIATAQADSIRQSEIQARIQALLAR